MVCGQLSKKAVRPYLKNKPGMVVYIYNFSFMGGQGKQDLSPRAVPGKK
jgi:hypothetical protein